MMVDTTVYGWVGDGDIVCSKCLGGDYMPNGADGIWADEQVWRPLYSIDDNECQGESCGDGSGYGCTGWVFEPHTEDNLSYCYDCEVCHACDGEACPQDGGD